MWTQWAKRRGAQIERVALTYTLPCLEAGAQLGLCDDLEAHHMRACVGGRLNREGTYVYIWLINFVVQQKLAQHCEAIILQFKKRDREKKKKKNLKRAGTEY